MRASDANANETWFRELRDRFVTVAARRVESDAVEDLVQEALRIVHEKSGIAPGTLVGEVVLSPAETALLAAARARGCPTQTGLDMLFEMIPAYLEFFGFPSATAEELRAGARLEG